MNDIAREHEEALLKLVVYEAVKAKSAEYMAEAAAADIDISETADARAKKLIDKEYRKHRIKSSGKTATKLIQRVAVAAAVVITVTFGVTMSVQALRDNYTRFLMTFDAESTRLEHIQENFDGNRIESGQQLGIDQHAPTYIPEGFIVKSLTMTDGDMDIYYENDEGKVISISRYASDSATHINSEHADAISTVDISGAQGILMVEDSMTTVTWNTENHYFVLFTYLNEEETLKIARSVKILE